MFSSTRVSWGGEGSATITAKVGDLQVDVPVTLQSPSVWTLYGTDDSGKIYAYPAGGGAPVLKYTITGTGPVWGFTLDSAARTIYYDRDLWIDSGDRAPDGSVIWAVAGTEFHRIDT